MCATHSESVLMSDSEREDTSDESDGDDLGSESESTFEKFFDYHRGQEVSLSDSAEPALSYEAHG